MTRELRFAHLSDWHATTLAGAGAEAYRGKRLSGWASWRLNRRRHHSPEILAAAFRDVQAQRFDGVMVTGDLTHISLDSEFRVAAGQLAELGAPDRVFLIPGNHDCYVPVEPSRSWDLWAPYLRGDEPGSLGADLAGCLADPGPSSRAPRRDDFPTLRLVGDVALVGLCSSIPTPVFRAGGELGARQLERLEGLLTVLGRAGYCRILMIHHPITLQGDSPRRSLWDGEALRAVLARVGADLVVHGHKHRRRIDHVAGPEREIPVIGVPSASEVGSRPDRMAQYHVYTVSRREEAQGGGFSLQGEVRGYQPDRRVFEPVEDSLL